MPIGPTSVLLSNDVYATLSAMITPAIFLTANGSLIISTSNRMSRIVDRIRVLNDLGDRIGRQRGRFRLPEGAAGERRGRARPPGLAQLPDPVCPGRPLPRLRHVRGNRV